MIVSFTPMVGILMCFRSCFEIIRLHFLTEGEPLGRALKKVLLTKASQINTNEGCSRFLNILHFFRFSER